MPKQRFERHELTHEWQQLRPLLKDPTQLTAEYPAFTLHEIATICYAQFGRRPSPHTIQLVLATGPKPSRTRRR